MLKELNAMRLSVGKIKPKRCLLGRKTPLSDFVKNLFKDLAIVVCRGQNTNVLVTLKIM